MYLFVVSIDFKCSTTFQRMHGSHAISNSIVWRWMKTLNEKKEWIVTHQLGPEIKVPRLFVCIHHANSERLFPTSFTCTMHMVVDLLADLVEDHLSQSAKSPSPIFKLLGTEDVSNRVRKKNKYFHKRTRISKLNQTKSLVLRSQCFSIQTTNVCRSNG